MRLHLQGVADRQHPHQYYPSRDIKTAAYEVDEVTPREIWLRVLLFPKETSGVKPQAFDIGLKAVGNGAKKDVAGQLLEREVGSRCPRRPKAARRGAIVTGSDFCLLLRLTPGSRRPCGVGAEAQRQRRQRDEAGQRSGTMRYALAAPPRRATHITRNPSRRPMPEQQNVGKIIEIKGVVIDAVFPDRLPEILTPSRSRLDATRHARRRGAAAPG